MHRILISLFVVIALTGTFTTQAQEICDNGIDDDLDGWVDLNDTIDCHCSGIQTLDISTIIPNHSFEDTLCCPWDFTELYCTSGWEQASGATSDYWNTCGLTGNALCWPPQPLPDGNGYAAFVNWDGYKEYVGTCLNSSLIAGQTYTIGCYVGMTGNRSPAFDIAFFGSSNCSDLPYPGIDCPTNSIGSWELLGQTTVTGTDDWFYHSVTFTPSQNINSLVVGPGCAIAGTGDWYYYYIDDITLLEELSSPLDITISSTGNPCTNNLALTAHPDTNVGDFQWYLNGIALPGATDTVFALLNLDAGIYSIRQTIDTACLITSIVIPEDSVVAHFWTENFCAPGVAPLVDSSSSSSTITSWWWDFGDGTSSTLPNPTHTYTGDGQYNIMLVVQDSIGCRDTLIKTIEAFPPPIVNFSTSSTQACDSLCTEFMNNTSPNSNNIVNWEWNLGNGTYSNASTPSACYFNDGDAPQLFDVTLIATNSNGCSDTSFIPNYITVWASPTAHFEAHYLPPNPLVTFSNHSTNSMQYYWDLGDGDTSTAFEPHHQYSEAGMYSIVLYASNTFGCLDSSMILLEIEPSNVLYVPNSFTPNGDGVNDVFSIYGDAIASDFQLSIFNRWGEEIHHSNLPYWDGNQLGKPVAIGTYIYRIVYKDLTQQWQKKVGHINLIR